MAVPSAQWIATKLRPFAATTSTASRSVDKPRGRPIGAIEHEGAQLAITHTGLQVDYLACAELQQLLDGHPA